ncbi:competence protein CoiA [Paenibacillus sp. B01]|uniref:competence protein CoiA n=1 Tax=Paenibacillus sp. B01 TaxID=2660554 RepID=UPI00129BDE5F|nr:competence protein CoiA [Paenibacillus sp. B01]QGG57098.1 competence protein CoiA [Paenibacillus sp. B01]
MHHADYLGETVYIESQLDSALPRAEAVKKLKKAAEKGAYSCRNCRRLLLVRDGQRGLYFAHNKNETCELQQSRITYDRQTARESKKHSVIREFVHDVLKGQEKLRPDLKVEMGYIAKAGERWAHLPDLVVRYRDREMAISILTNVDRRRDRRLVQTLKKRQQFFKDQGMETLWFIDEGEQSIDPENRVIYLWESELDLSSKTDQDQQWDELLEYLSGVDNAETIFRMFGYRHAGEFPPPLDTRSLYYVHSTDEGIFFSVHRFLPDQRQMPFQAFALNDGYRMGIDTALSFETNLALHHPIREAEDKERFKTLFLEHAEAWTTKMQAKQSRPEQQVETAIVATKSAAAREWKPREALPARMRYNELEDFVWDRFNMTQQQQLRLWHEYVMRRGLKRFERLWELAETVDTFTDFEALLKQEPRH